ncbi:hypothetical protein KUTeg_001627 [Tegillarca granosa]|uniref:Uncharacterized protein n=1 Tax=Tegillarca granosa TaxID=220873 RepID=A0ABQ9FWB4_TEGGR|nr:hypothetical protein KUTeg_001627 [Tegillarca granosa]
MKKLNLTSGISLQRALRTDPVLPNSSRVETVLDGEILSVLESTSNPALTFSNISSTASYIRSSPTTKRCVMVSKAEWLKVPPQTSQTNNRFGHLQQNFVNKKLMHGVKYDKRNRCSTIICYDFGYDLYENLGLLWDTNQNEDMDISPGSTPTSSRPSSCAGTPQIGPGSTPATQTIPSSAALALGHHHQSGSSTPLISSIPQLITQLSGGQNNQELTQKEIVSINQQVPPQQSPRSTNDIPVTSATILSNIPTTYQTLKSPQHGPLQGGPHPIPQHISHQGSQQHVSTHQAGPPISGHHQNSYHTLTSPHHEPIIIQNQNTTSTQQLLPPPATIAPPHVQQHQASVYGRLSSQPQIDSDLHVENSKGGESPLSESSQRSSCSVASPSSTTSSQNALNVEASALSVAMKKESPATGMNSSLSNYYNERLIGHVLGWQADHAERQANRYAEEGITVGSFRCSQVSVELKRARSLVRLAEIQSTLHEQRLLFLDQQIHELESMKPPNFSSSHSFPSSSGSGGGGQ